MLSAKSSKEAGSSLTVVLPVELNVVESLSPVGNVAVT